MEIFLDYEDYEDDYNKIWLKTYEHICEDCVHRDYDYSLKASVCTLCNQKIKCLEKCPLGIGVEDVKEMNWFEREENKNNTYSNECKSDPNKPKTWLEEQCQIYTFVKAELEKDEEDNKGGET